VGPLPVPLPAQVLPQQARLLVQRSDKSIRDIAAATGFASPSHLTARYTPRFGASPQKERETRDLGLAFKERMLS
jgi:AraC-like DNA-binding protein